MVYALEEINFHQHARRVRRFALAGRQLPVQPAFQRPAIGQPGQGIDFGLFAQTALQFKLPRPHAETRQELAIDNRFGEEIVNAGFQGLVKIIDRLASASGAAYRPRPAHAAPTGSG